MKIRNRFLAALISLTLMLVYLIPANFAFAESATISASVDKTTFNIGDTFKYTLTLDYTGQLSSTYGQLTHSDNVKIKSFTNGNLGMDLGTQNPDTGLFGHDTVEFPSVSGTNIMLYAEFEVLEAGPIFVTVSITDLTDENASNISFTVDPSTKTLNFVTEGYVDPDVTAITTAKNKIAALTAEELTIAQAEAANEEAVKTEINDIIASILSENEVTGEVTVTAYSAATAGTKENVDGINGSYSFTVKLSKNGKNDTVTNGAGVISATPYVHDTHTFTYVTEKSATCTEDGVQAHYVCEECGKVFTDQDPDTETTLDALVIKAGHKFEKPDAHHAAVEATCDTDGSIEYYVCDVCGKKFATKDSTTELTNAGIVIKAHHTLGELVPEVEATCTIEGSKAYYECTVCHKKFADAEGTQEIDNIVIPALSHSLKEHPEVPATCTETGTEAYWECTRDTCGKLFSDAEGNKEIVAPETIAALGHNMTRHEAVASTCTTHGTIEYWSCDRCGKNFKDNQGAEIADSLEAPLAAHTLTSTEAKVPTATTDGNIAYWTCSVCNKKFSDEKGTTEVTDVTIPALGEQVEEIIEENVQLTTEAVTQDQAVAQIVAQVKEALKNDDYDVTVNVSSFVAPVAGTAEKPEGTAGQIVYMVTITNPENAEDTMTTTAQTLAIAAKEYVAPTAPTYTITVNGAYVDKNTAKEGETVTVTAPYRYGYTFIGWKTSANLTLANRSPVSFKMPAGNVTIEPVYTYNPIYYPPVDYDPPVISKPVTKPEKVEDGWHGDQYYQDGEPVVGWLEVTHGTWYYFDRSGSMVTGWEKVNGTWYYMLDSGVMATGWVKVDGSWYFLKSSGAMATGWLWDNGHWYYLSGSGAMKTGWVLSGSKWYYLNTSGAMVTGWVEWKGDWYYMNTPNGDMAVDTKTPDGYYVNSDGIWVK